MTQKKGFFTENKATKVLAVLLAFAVLVGAYFYHKATLDPQKEAQKALAQAVADIGKLIVLPTDETPTMATVTDPTKLSAQPFFAHAEKGDEVLVYTAARKAILYSPKLNKIIEVAPVNLGNTGAPANGAL